MADTAKSYGYVGKIARINLTHSTVEIIPTGVQPDLLGGGGPRRGGPLA